MVNHVRAAEPIKKKGIKLESCLQSFKRYKAVSLVTRARLGTTRKAAAPFSQTKKFDADARTKFANTFKDTPGFIVYMKYFYMRILDNTWILLFLLRLFLFFFLVLFFSLLFLLLVLFFSFHFFITCIIFLRLDFSCAGRQKGRI